MLTEGPNYFQIGNAIHHTIIQTAGTNPFLKIIVKCISYPFLS